MLFLPIEFGIELKNPPLEMGVRSLEPSIVMLNVFQHLEQTDLLASKFPLDGQKFDVLWKCVIYPLLIFDIFAKVF